ncbi:MAG: hypothetical protein Phog2KO_07240 [Phototrophicaceae bacterium]
MYNNGQWSGNGQEDMANSLRVLVEITPQIPFDKLIYQARILRKKVLKRLASRREEKRKRHITLVSNQQQDAPC